MKPGESVTLTATIKPDKVADKTVCWSSSEPKVATVDSKGMVSALTVGKTIVTASVDDCEAQCTVYVPSLAIKGGKSELKPNEKTQLSATLLPSDLPNKALTWASSNNAIAKVDKNGLVTAVAPGVVTITASDAYGNSADYQIMVYRFSINKTECILTAGKSETLVINAEPKELASKPVAWSSSDVNCVTVDQNGEVKVIGFGEAVVAAALTDYPDISASCTITAAYENNEISYTYKSETKGAVITQLPNVECFIIPDKVSAPYGDGVKSFTVTQVALTSQPTSLRKVAYPEGIPTNFSSSVIALSYNVNNSTVSNGIIIDPSLGRLVFVDTSISGTFEIEPKISNVGKNAFALCSGINELRIANASTELKFEGTSQDSPAFTDMPITAVYVDRNVDYQVSPFRGNTGITNLTFGSNITRISDNMFYGCSAIREISLPENIVNVDNGAFAYCTGLSQFIIEDSRNPIEITNAFGGSTMDYLYYGRKVNNTVSFPTSLKALETGRYVESLGDNEFTNYPNLYSLTIGMGLRALSVKAFNNSKITKVIWMPNTPPTGYENIKADINYVSTDNYEFSNKIVNSNLSSKFMVDGLVYVFNRKASNRTCAVIDTRYNRYITSLDVQHKLTYMNIEFTVEEINDYGLYCNQYYKSASIGDGIISVGNYAFSGCFSLEEFSLGNQVNTIGAAAFSGCDKMRELRSYNRVPPVCGDQAMDDINKFVCTLYVPHSALNEYKRAPQWEDFFLIEGMDTGIIEVENITLDPQEWSGYTGSTFTISATVLPANADDKRLSWSSSDVTVATVDETGKVSVIGEGTCAITARANDGSNISASCLITAYIPSGIEAILENNDGPVKVYTVQGHCINISTIDELRKLVPGIYIVNGKKVIVK